MVTEKKRQATMAEAFTKKARTVVMDDMRTQQCLSMVEQGTELSQWELMEPQKTLLEALSQAHLTNYEKHFLSDTQLDEDAKLSVKNGDTWCTDGEKFVRSIAQLMRHDDSKRFPKWVSEKLATIVGNHGRHDIPSLSSDAQRLLMQILEKQPPATVQTSRAGTSGMSGKTVSGPPLVLLTPPPDLEPWVCLRSPNGWDGPAQPVVTRHRRSSTCTPSTAKAKLNKIGVHCFVEWQKTWKVLLDELDDETACAETARESSSTDLSKKIESKDFVISPKVVLGEIWVAQYLLSAWKMDLDARIAVIDSHAENPKQKKQSQKLLMDSYAFRAMSDVAEAQLLGAVETALDWIATWQDDTGIADDMAQRPLVSELLDVQASFVRLTLSLFGAAEDLGLSSKSHDNITVLTVKRHMLDSALMSVLRHHSAWPAILRVLLERDRLRVMSMLLSHCYYLMHMSNNETAKHGAKLFVEPGELWGTNSLFRSPGTFVDMPPGATMRILCHTDLLRRFFVDNIFDRDCDRLCTFVYHFCHSALTVLPALLRGNRFRAVPGGEGSAAAAIVEASNEAMKANCSAPGARRTALAGKVAEPAAANGAMVLEPPGVYSPDGMYSQTHGHLEEGNRLTKHQRKAAMKTEVATMLRGLEMVVDFVDKQVQIKLQKDKRDELSLQAEDATPTQCGLRKDVLEKAVVAGVLQRHSVTVMSLMHARLSRTLSKVASL